MAVAPLVGGAQRALDERRATELTAPYDERVVEQATLLEVEHQRGRRRIGVTTLDRQLRVQVVVLVPAGVHHLHETPTAIDQPARHRSP
jgi:hypothetical protein